MNNNAGTWERPEGIALECCWGLQKSLRYMIDVEVDNMLNSYKARIDGIEFIPFEPSEDHINVIEGARAAGVLSDIMNYWADYMVG